MTPSRVLAVPAPLLGLIAVGIGALVLLSSVPLLGWAYADWVAVSATTREGLVYAGPWLAACTAWTAGRYLGPRSMLCLPSAVRSGHPIVTAQAILLTVAALSGYLLGLAPLLIWTAHNAQAGSLNWLVFAGSTAVLLTFGALGYVIGCITPRAASVVLATAVAFAAVLLVDTWGPAVAPLRLSTPAAGQYETGVVATFRAVYFTVTALALVCAASRWVADRSTVRRVASFSGLLILAAPLLLGALARSTAPPAVLRESTPAPSCAPSRSIPVCVHPAKAALLTPLRDTVDKVLQIVDYQPAVPISGVFDAALDRDQIPLGSVVLDLQTSGQDWGGWAAGDLASYLAGQPACLRRGDVFGDDAAPAVDRAAVSAAFSSWIATTAGFTAPQLSSDGATSPLTARLQQLDPGQVQALYHRFATGLASCQLPSSDLP